MRTVHAARPSFTTATNENPTISQEDGSAPSWGLLNNGHYPFGFHANASGPPHQRAFSFGSLARWKRQIVPFSDAKMLQQSYQREPTQQNSNSGTTRADKTTPMPVTLGRGVQTRRLSCVPSLDSRSWSMCPPFLKASRRVLLATDC